MSIVFGVLVTAAAYLIGSISWPILISKFIFKQDIREIGSNKPDYLNVSNSFGFKWGVIVIVLDFLKTIVSMTIAMCFEENACSFAGIAACAGHYFPLFTDFKGDKSISTAFGFLLGLSIFTESDIIFTFIYPLLAFLAILFLIKYLTVASIATFIIETVIAFMTNDSILISIEILVLTLAIIYEHRTNIYKLIKGKENRVSFIK